MVCFWNGGRGDWRGIGVGGSTICRPLIPIMKSYQGSMGISGFLLRRTWKPDAENSLRVDCEGLSESRREMNRLRAPNMVAILYG